MISSKSIQSFLLCAAFLLPELNSGAERPHGFFPDRQERDALKHIYNTTYDHNPSMLSWWDYSTWSVIRTDGHITNGKLHSPIEPDGQKGLTISTESILHQQKSGWSFSGKFEYGIDITDSLRSTLSYNKRPNGSPSMYFCIAPAQRWEIQHYALEATASKKLGTNWSAGIQIKYVGGKQFRKTDVRNDQTSLDINIDAGATGLFGKNMLSAGLSYERHKEKPNFSRAYNSGADWFIYLMTGLGTQLTGLENEPSWRQNVPGIYIGWGRRGDRNRLNTRYLFSYGEDCWKNEARQSASKQSKMTKYHFIRHTISLTDILTMNCGGRMIFDGSVSFISGNNSNWNNTTKQFIDNYSVITADGNIGVRYVNSRSWFRKAGIDANLNGENRHDKNYDSKLNDISLDSDIFASFGLTIGKADISLDVCGGVFSWLSADYEPNAAKDGFNIYTTYIGKANEAYMNAGQWHAGTSVSVEFLAGKTLISIGASYKYNGTSANNIYKGTKRQSGNLFLNVSF